MAGTSFETENGKFTPESDDVQIPLEEWERLKTVEECYRLVAPLGTGDTIYRLKRRIRELEAAADNCRTCPYKQAVASMTRSYK